MIKETIINVTFDERDDYVNQFNENKLSNKLSNYILEECRGKSLKNKITICIKMNYQISNKEKEEIINMIHANYEDDLKEYMIVLKYSIIKKIIIFFIGVALIYLSYFKNIINNEVVSEIILIIAWVAIWEVVYTWFFESDKNRLKVKRLKQLIKCQIKFE